MTTLIRKNINLVALVILLIGLILSIITVEAQEIEQGQVHLSIRNKLLLDLQNGTDPIRIPTNDLRFAGPGILSASWELLTSNAEWTARNQHSSVILPNGSILLMGGIDNSGDLNDIWRSNDGGATWTQVTDNAEWSARRAHTSVVLPDGSIVLFGGFTQVSGSLIPRNDVWRSTTEGETWHLMTDSPEWPSRINSPSLVLPDGDILLIGGGLHNDVWRSDDKGKTWTLVSDDAGWQKRSSHSTVLLPGGEIVLIGGADSNFKMLNDVWHSDDQGVTWSQVTESAEWTGRFSHSSVVLPDGSILLIGGWVGSANGEVWQSSNGGATWTLITDASAWTARYGHTSEVLPDESVLLIGGYLNIRQNDVWRMIMIESFDVFLPLINR